MNTRRMNRLEELGRVDAEKADTRKGKRNLREEKSRIVRELKATGGRASGKRRKMGPDARDKAKGKKGQKIPAKKLNAAAKKGGKLGQRARLAKTLKGFKK